MIVEFSFFQYQEMIYLVTLILFSRTLCVKHYLIETEDNVVHNDTVTTPSTNLVPSSKLRSKFWLKTLSEESSETFISLQNVLVSPAVDTERQPASDAPGDLMGTLE